MRQGRPEVSSRRIFNAIISAYYQYIIFIIAFRSIQTSLSTASATMRRNLCRNAAKESALRRSSTRGGFHWRGQVSVCPAHKTPLWSYIICSSQCLSFYDCAITFYIFIHKTCVYLLPRILTRSIPDVLVYANGIRIRLVYIVYVYNI